MKNYFGSIATRSAIETANMPSDHVDQTLPDHEKANGVVVAAETGSPVDSDDDSSTHKEFQAGVKDIEAATSVWSKAHLITAYVLIWFILFVSTFQQSMGYSFSAYVVSSFGAHSLLSTTTILSALIGGLTKLPLAKILDIWGRPQGFALMLFIEVIGLIMMAACQNVETYAAAQVFYWVGHNGLDYSLQIFIADTSALKNRALMFAFSNSPYLITAFAGGPAATQFLATSGYAWGYGAFAILMPVVSAPLLALFWVNHQKAKNAGLIQPRNSGRTVGQSIWHYIIEFDVAGLLLLTTGLALFLLPFSIVALQPQGWQSPLIISFLIIGFVLCICFALFEKYLAPKSFIPFALLTDRTVLGSCICAGTFFISFYLWDNYFFSFLQVVNGQSITQASYIGNIYTMGSVFWGLLVGVAVRLSGRFKWIAVYFAVPLHILAVGLMIYFRQPDMNVGYLIMCQIFIAFAGGSIVICQEMAAMAAASHQHVAVVLAVQAMFTSIGQAIGSTVAAAIWTNVFPMALRDRLPADAQDLVSTISASLYTQMSYPVGTPIRDAINYAYGDAQTKMLAGATGILAVAWVAVMFWRDIKVSDIKQVRGRVV